ncbi:oxidoreductase [Nonomuraea sp. B10E15]|uniref:oxidoreductase n=1 Tax=unclassified Nonomuraea TaxID=2593643 RepID=UPI00325EB889
MSWTPASMPALAGTTAIVTGANTGIGKPTALELARHGAHVVVAARDPDRGAAAVAEIRRAAPGAHVGYGRLDLADLASVREFVKEFATGVERLDLLVNNAGVGMVPRRETRDGFELQLGTNHLGHFALTGLLLPLLLAAPAARVVTVASDAHVAGRIDLDDLGMRHDYGRMAAYARSKLANMLFALELQRRAERAGAGLISVATHPGMTATGIFGTGLVKPVVNLLMKRPERGAVSSLYAAASPDVRGGEYIGPTLRRLTPSATARSRELARRLWEASTELTGVRFEELAPG